MGVRPKSIRVIRSIRGGRQAVPEKPQINGDI
jgi:hypothetical protein